MKKWLINTFLPLWAKETVLADNRRLCGENRRLQEKIKQQQAYIHGLHRAIRGNRRIIFNNGGDK